VWVADRRVVEPIDGLPVATLGPSGRVTRDPQSELARLKDLERENARLKKLVAELTLDKQILQDVLSKKD